MQALTVNTAQDQILSAKMGSIADRSHFSGGVDHRAARETAEQFEAIFLSQMIAPMFETIPTDSFMGGGHAESVYRGMMVEEMGKSIAKSGGIGIADSVYREIIKMQEG